MTMPPAPAAAPPVAPPPRTPAPPRAPMTAPAARPSIAIPTFGKVSSKPLPPRVILNGVEGWGKTSLAVQAPGAAIIMARGETGYSTLVGAGRVPSIPALTVESWEALLGVLDQLIASPGEVRALVLDALGGFERLCHEHVCQRDFGGVWTDKGFGSFAKGYDIAVTDWLGLLTRLDRIHQSGVAIWILSHVQVKNFKNPLGSDFDRYESACHAKTWGVTHKWADAVLFATFRTITDTMKGEQRKKGIGGTDRVIYAERRDAWDAKNRYGMPDEIDIPGSPEQAYAIIQSLTAPKGTP